MVFSIFLLILFLTTPLLAAETEFSGNLEAQSRHSWNNPEAKDLFQNWNQKDFHLIYGNLNGKVQFKDSKLEANWFVRHSYSELYKDHYVAPQIYTFPNSLVARNLFKLEYKNQGSYALNESILNKLYYEWNAEGNRFAVGRMYINYGLGEIFNPINPFNQPTGLTSISQVAQGSDGASFTYYVDDQHTIDFYLLADKNLAGYENKITKTVWIHGEYQVSEKLQVDYVLGEDQKRDKFGTQISYRFEEAMAFLQTLYQTDYLDNKPSQSLLDVLLGYDQQLSSKWHIRMEGGYQEQNKYQTTTFGTRFLPTEYFAALALVDEIHPLLKISGTLINDVKSGFTYFIAKNTFDLGHNSEAEIFGFIPVSKGQHISNPAQKLVTTDIGVALRTFF
jgi:hypothetical protein